MPFISYNLLDSTKLRTLQKLIYNIYLRIRKLFFFYIEEFNNFNLLNARIGTTMIVFHQLDHK